jgi:hypothetical protein
MQVLVFNSFALIFSLTIVKVYSAISFASILDKDILEDEFLNVQIQDIYGIRNLPPLKLANGFSASLKPFGYFIAFEKDNPPTKILLRSSELEIPVGLQNLLIVTSENGKRILKYPIKELPEFENIILPSDDGIMRIFILNKKIPALDPHHTLRREDRKLIRGKKRGKFGKGDNKRKNQFIKEHVASNSLKKLHKDLIIGRIRELFFIDARHKPLPWLAIQYGVVNSLDIKDATVYQIQPNLDHYVLQFFPNSFHFIKIEPKLISLNRFAKRLQRVGFIRIKLEISIDGFDKNNYPIPTRGVKTRIFRVKDNEIIDLCAFQLSPTKLIMLLLLNGFNSPKPNQALSSIEYV